MAAEKITVIGAGSVGATTAFALALKNLANEIVLVDINENKALGEAMDIHQASPLFTKPVNVTAGTYETAAGSDIVVITSGMPRKPGQPRIDLAQNNVDVMKDIASKITKTCPDATYIIVSNPVDILTYVFNKVSGIPEDRIIGSGTLLDTVRLRARIAQYLNVSQKNVHAYVFGEHGETSFVPWSISEVSTIPLQDYKKNLILYNDTVTDLDYDEIYTYMRSSGSKIIERKGCTNYAIAVSVCTITDHLTSGVNSVDALSTMLHGEYGLEDVCLSLPTLIGEGVVQGRITPELNEKEIEQLYTSANALKSVISQLKI